MLSHLDYIFIRQNQNTDQRGNDLIDLMIDAMEDKLSHEVYQDGGQFEKDARLTHLNKKREFDMTTLAATALVLLFAGYDTTGITLGYVAYMLAVRPDIQDELADKVDKAFDDNGGKMPSYTAIQES